MAFQLIQHSHSGNFLSDGGKGGGGMEQERKGDRVERGSEQLVCFLVYMAKRMRNATIRQKRPIASDRAKPRMA